MATGSWNEITSASTRKRHTMTDSGIDSVHSSILEKSSIASRLETSPRKDYDHTCEGISLKRYPEGSPGPPCKYQDFKFNKEAKTISAGPGTEVDDSSVVTALDNWKNQWILVSGSAGSGKTTVLKQIVHRFQSAKDLLTFDKLLYFNISTDKNIFEAGSAQEIIKIQKYQESVSHQVLLNSTGLRSLIIFQCGRDFADKMAPGSVTRKILEREIVPESTILFVCSLSVVEHVQSIMKVDHHYTLLGFTESGRNRYLKLTCAGNPWILPYLEQKQLLHMCTKPLICSLLAETFGKHFGKQKAEPKTLTEFIYKLVCALLFYYLDPEEKTYVGSVDQMRLESLPESVENTFEANCFLAIEHLLKGCKCANNQESQQFLSSFTLKVIATDMFRFGLVDISLCSQNAYEFIDPLVTEFLAAFYLQKQPPINQLYFLYRNTLPLFMSDFKLWLQFFFGLVGKNSHVGPYNPTKLMMNTVIDLLVIRLELNHEAEHRYSLIKCIHELQEKSLFRKLVSKHPAVLSFSLSIEEFDVNLEPTLSVINKSGYEEWTIMSSSGSIQIIIASLKRQVHGVTIKEVVDDLNQERVSLSPKRTSADVTKMYRDADSSKKMLLSKEKAEKFNQLCCRAVREILQRVFPLYSEVKIKGDASNVSYVSFLTCRCFEESFSKHVKLFPLQPVHFLSGPKKDLSKIPPELLTSTDRHNIAKHNGESMEVVIMLRPLVQKVEGIVPIINESFSLILSGDLVLDFSTDVKSELVAMERCVDPYVVGGDHTERILPTLPIVKKTISGRAQTAYPRPFLPPAQAPPIETMLVKISDEVANTQIDSCRNSNSSTLNPTVLTQLHAGSKLMVAVNDSQGPSPNAFIPSERSRITGPSLAQAVVPTSIQPSPGAFVQNFAEQEVRVHPATSRRQTALRPGTVLYTSMPEKLPSDRIQPLPLQQTLIRKGGNGSIFSENVGGTAMAVKKTSYRSKEYSIITKIKHKNIIPLLAYVWGEEHRENKRRYYVYHYLPKLSGDLARLVTDKEELSLYEFHKMNQNNLRAMGVAVGNIKYTLSQVLQGLQYLHSAHIAHRDLKASNVLIKFFCGCASPLECACEVKYQVVLCDFDAAIELNSSDRVPLTPSPPSRPHTGASPHAEIVPVGTNGFRSPESSMLTIANTPEAFSPPLTTKTDIYSFGILCMRLMISTDTPYSQRKMATLLLHYHQMKGLSEGRIGTRLSQFHRLDEKTTRLLTGRKWLNFLEVPEDTVHKILKLKKLKPRMAWLKGGFDFVSQCLSVDPEARPSASALLDHPFLY